MLPLPGSAIVPDRFWSWDKNATIPSPAYAVYENGANSFRPIGQFGGAAARQITTLEFPRLNLPDDDRRRDTFAVRDEPDFIVSGWGCVSTNWPDPGVSQSL
jgi:hypothetical protein